MRFYVFKVRRLKNGDYRKVLVDVFQRREDADGFVARKTEKKPKLELEVREAPALLHGQFPF